MSQPSLSNHEMSDDDMPLVRLKRTKKSKKKKRKLSSIIASRPVATLSRRDEFLQCPLLDLQSKEGHEGDSEVCSGAHYNNILTLTKP
jgi:hypothetical protein